VIDVSGNSSSRSHGRRRRWDRRRAKQPDIVDQARGDQGMTPPARRLPTSSLVMPLSETATQGTVARSSPGGVCRGSATRITWAPGRAELHWRRPLPPGSRSSPTAAFRARNEPGLSWPGNAVNYDPAPRAPARHAAMPRQGGRVRKRIVRKHGADPDPGRPSALPARAQQMHPALCGFARDREPACGPAAPILVV